MGVEGHFERYKMWFNYKIDPNNIPAHVAIIMDGNRRWAKRRKLPIVIGHSRGAENLNKVVDILLQYGVKYLTVYAFSTENWNRPQNEVDDLMRLLCDYLSKVDGKHQEQKVRIKVIGNRDRLSSEILDEIKRVEMVTAQNEAFTFNIALNYGGRREILDAVKKIAQEAATGKIDIESIDTSDIAEGLYTAGMPDPDLLIRTGGEKRISNFLLWQLAYTELWYTDVLWPDFDKRHLLRAIKDYQKRNRRYGGI